VAPAVRSAPVPSFVLMDLQGLTATTYVYELVNGEVGVKKIEHTKG
jgi:vacuolar protein sorting-associated protein 29